MRFDAMQQAWKRAAHFCGPVRRSKWRWAVPLRLMPTTGAGVIAHNYSAMQDAQDTALDQLMWCDAVAQAINRYVDSNRVEGDETAKRVMAWWRRQVPIDPTKIRGCND